MSYNWPSDYGLANLFDTIRNNRVSYLSRKSFASIPRQNKRYAQETAETAGRFAANLYHYLGIPKKWGTADYATFVIEPLFGAKLIDRELRDWWFSQCAKKRLGDLRVKAFIAAAQEVTDLRGGRWDLRGGR